MIQEVVTGTHIIFYLMIAVGVVGVFAKIANQLTLRRLITAASGMSKSTHKLMKLVRAKYEHACMLHDKVDNTRVFVEKYIYEYRGMIFHIHTWRQLQLQSVWFAGILAAIGALSWYSAYGICEEAYQYLMLGAAEMITLYVVSQLSDESYKLEAVKNYMVDYLENICTFRYRRGRQPEREQIDVIRPDGNASQAARMSPEEGGGISPELSINIEGEPRKNAKGGARQIFRKSVKGKNYSAEARRETEPVRMAGEGQPEYRNGRGGSAQPEKADYKEEQPENLSAQRAYRGTGNSCAQEIFAETGNTGAQRAYAEAGNRGAQRAYAETGNTGAQGLYAETESASPQGVYAAMGNASARAAYTENTQGGGRVERTPYREEQPPLREEQIRQILEEFLA